MHDHADVFVHAHGILSLQVQELPVRPDGRCLIGAINATIVGKEVYLAVEREAVGTAGAGRPVRQTDRDQVCIEFQLTITWQITILAATEMLMKC